MDENESDNEQNETVSEELARANVQEIVEVVDESEKEEQSDVDQEDQG